MLNQYEYVARVGELYSLLEDKLSKDIFLARLAYDLEPSQENKKKIGRLGGSYKWMKEFEKGVSDIVSELEQKPKKLVLYGTRDAGQAIAAVLREQHIDFYGFCGRRAKDFTNGLLGKPVISPDYLFSHPDDFYIIVSVKESHDEIIRILKENNFPLLIAVLRTPTFRPGGFHSVFRVYCQRQTSCKL